MCVFLENWLKSLKFYKFCRPNPNKLQKNDLAQQLHNTYCVCFHGDSRDYLNGLLCFFFVINLKTCQNRWYTAHKASIIIIIYSFPDTKSLGIAIAHYIIVCVFMGIAERTKTVNSAFFMWFTFLLLNFKNIRININRIKGLTWFYHNFKGYFSLFFTVFCVEIRVKNNIDIISRMLFQQKLLFK